MKVDLPGPIGAEQPEHAGADVERDALEGGDGAGIDLHEVANAEHWRRAEREA